MTAPTERTLNYGARHMSVFELNTNNTPKATAPTAYEGLQVKSFVNFELTQPSSRKLTGLGEDGITTVVFLAPNEGMDAKASVEATDPVLTALLGGVKNNTIGEITTQLLGSDKQGFEPRIAAMVYQAAKGLVTGKTYWHTYFLPSCQAVRKAHGMNGEKGMSIYEIAPNCVSQHLWGPAFTEAADGGLSSQIVEAWSNYPLRVAAFLAGVATVDFVFPVASPAVQTTGIKVYVDEVEVTTNITKAVDKVTFATAPGENKRVVILREVAG
jgi:hypothetical protein